MEQSASDRADQPPLSIRLTDKYPLDAPLATLDGVDLRVMLRAACDWLAAHYELVNRLNVFPVKDGDTGSNMLLTMRAACAAIEHGSPVVGNVIHAAAEGALRGSRGNSGVILSQILRGMGQQLTNQRVLTPVTLATALHHASELAYRSVPSPVEGTILTVIREVAQAAMRTAPAATDLRTFFAGLVGVADEAVQRTPELLPILKQAGVVDSGGKGLFLIFEGMQRALAGELVVADAAGPVRPAASQDERTKGSRPLPPVRWGFDVQCLIEQPNAPVATIRQAVMQMGEYPLVEGDEQLVKLHVHVFDPGVPLSYAVQIGFVTDVIVENMDDMAAHVAATLAPVAPTVLSDAQSVHEPPPTDGIGLVAVTPGDGFATLFRNLGVGVTVDGGETMNPSTEELLAGVERLPNLRVLILPNNSNVLLAAQQAAELAMQTNPSRQVLVLPTKTLPQGIAAVLACNPASEELAKAAALMQERITQLDTGEVAQAVRSAEFDGLAVEVGDFIGLHDGRLVTRGPTLETVVLALLEQMAADESELITLYYGEQIEIETAENLKEIVRNRYPDQDVELAYGGQHNFFYILSTE
jgi:DAK2 domain fusion protein YloV